ncbi:hypothetical protein [Pseudogemmobacter sonorensis]|uniref:hypothetical protein n=1 Tax=Pseudogemmobacter sonorensis TaxID=2989681 RepID=UPI0036892CD8
MSYHVESRCSNRKFGSAPRKQIAMYLANKAGDDGSGIWCSKHTIARDTELSLATVKRTIRDFLAEGILVAIGMRETSRHGQTVIYRIALEVVDELEPLLPAKAISATGVTVNPVQPAPATGVRVSPPPGSQRPPNNPMNNPMNHPPSRHAQSEAEEEDLQPIWDAFPSDRRRDRAACRRHLAAALSEASRDELVIAAKAYTEETAEYTRRTVMFFDNWLRVGRWRRYVEAHRQQRSEAEARDKVNDETIIANAAKWIQERSDMCRHVPLKRAAEAVKRGLVTREQAQAAGVMP